MPPRTCRFLRRISGASPLFLALLCFGQTGSGPPGTISGRLTNFFTGGPIRKGVVEIHAEGLAGFTRSAVSDGSGQFSISGIPAGRYRLTVRRNGFLPAVYGASGPNRPGKALVLKPGEQRADVNFALRTAAVISGRVLDEDAEPAAGVAVQALREDFSRGDAQYMLLGSAATDDLGVYRLFGLPPGKYFVLSVQTPVNPGASGELVYSSVFYPAATDFAAAAMLNLSAGSEARDIDLHVSKVRTSTVRGSVVNLPAGMERSLQVQISRADRNGIAFGNRFVGGFNAGTGRFEFSGLTPGTYNLLGSLQDHASFLYGRQEIDAAGSDLNDIRLTLSSGIELSGSVQFLGGPPAEASAWRVRLTRSVQSGPNPSATLNADFSFQLKNVTPGSWTVGITPIPRGAYIASIRYGNRDALTKPVTIGSSADGPLTIVIGLQGATAEGIVRMAGANGSSVEGATVLLVSDRDHRAVPGYCKTSVSDHTGHYTITGIAPGRYSLLALDDLEPMAWRNPQFLESLEGKGQELTVQTGSQFVKDLVLEQ